MKAEHWTLYLDESGDPGWRPPRGNSATEYFAVGGLALTPEMDHLAQSRVAELVKKYLGDKPGLELRFSGLYARRGAYRNLSWPQAQRMLDEVIDLLHDLKPRIFGTVVVKERHQAKYGYDAYDPKLLALRGLVQRFDLTLSRLDAYGQVVMDEEQFKRDAKLREMVYFGKRHGLSIRGMLYSPRFASKPTRISGTINFTPSEYSPGVQLADTCCGILWRKFERGQVRYYKRIEDLFDRYPGGAEPSVIPW